jgi:hypothetical protein
VGVVARQLSPPSIYLFLLEKISYHQYLFMLVSALMGLERMRGAYAHAIAGGYRFYPYGDASLLLP